MLTLVIVIILLAALGVLGTVIEGLFWLTVIAVVLILAGLAYGWTKYKSSPKT